MYDIPQPRYLDHKQKERLKPFDHGFHDGNPTSKHDFSDLHLLSRLRSHFLIVIFLGIPL